MNSHSVKHISVKCSSAFSLHFTFYFFKPLPMGRQVSRDSSIITLCFYLLSCLILHVTQGWEWLIDVNLEGIKLSSKYNSLPWMLDHRISTGLSMLGTSLFCFFLPIMLCCSAHEFHLKCSRLCSQFVSIVGSKWQTLTIIIFTVCVCI